jgi:hypothetical protein
MFSMTMRFSGAQYRCWVGPGRRVEAAAGLEAGEDCVAGFAIVSVASVCVDGCLLANSDMRETKVP